MPGGHAVLGCPVVEGTDDFVGIAKPVPVVSVVNDHLVAGVGLARQVQAVDGQRVHREVRADARRRRRPGQGHAYAPAEQAIGAVTGPAVVGAVLALHGRVEDPGRGLRQVTGRAPRRPPQDRHAGQFRMRAGERQCHRQPPARLGSFQRGHVEQAGIQTAAQIVRFTAADPASAPGCASTTTARDDRPAADRQRRNEQPRTAAYANAPVPAKPGPDRPSCSS